MRLSDKGMHRWYCGECKTPVGNTVSSRIPFVGLIHTFMDHESDGRARDEVLGKPLGYVQAKFAIGTPPSPPDHSSLFRVMARSARLLAKWWLTGAGSPSPFFDKGGVPRAEPQVLRPEQRAAL